MARYRVVCTRQVPPDRPNDQAHIVEVGTNPTPDSYSRLWTVREVIEAMSRGDTFYTQGERSGKVARVEVVRCPICGRPYLRSAPDAVEDNNLDNLPTCNVS